MRFQRQIFLIDLVTILFVVGIFQIIPDKRIAALVASAFFFINATWIAYVARHRKIVVWMNALFVLGFVFTLPMLRILHWDVPLIEITILGFPAQLLHRSATGFFILKTLIEIFEFRRAP